MTKTLKLVITSIAAVSILLSGCSKAVEPQKKIDAEKIEKKVEEQQKNNEPKTKEGSEQQSKPDETSKVQPEIDLQKVKPNEAGKIMVVMFHNFIETYKSGDKEYTTTFGDFRNLLQELYDKGYRLINVSDYLNNNVSVPAGCIPMVFTFDDGTAGQFNLVEENGKLVANKDSAVGIMEEFNKTHPDFGLKGTFYVNLGLSTFEGKGSVQERLKYLVDKGFEIGNHTYSHISLPQAKSAAEIQKEVGGNQKKMLEFIPDYKFNSLALPFGQASKNLQSHVEKGEFEGVPYDNKVIMLVGANPTVSPISKSFNPLATARVRASGIKPVDCDLAWWLQKMSRSEQYISDGNPATVTIPAAKESNIDKDKLNGKKLITY